VFRERSLTCKKNNFKKAPAFLPHGNREAGSFQRAYIGSRRKFSKGGIYDGND